MSLLYVRYKKTGEEGILDTTKGKFDPNEFELLGGDEGSTSVDTTSQPSTQTNVQPQKQGDIIDSGVSLINNLLSPFKESGKRIGEASNQITKLIFDPVFRDAVLGGDLSKYSPEQLRAYNQQPESLFMSPQELQAEAADPRKALINQVGRGAQMVSYGIPVGGATKIAGANIALSPFKGGAVIGALQSAGQQLEDTQNIDPAQTLISAGLGGATGSLLNKIFGGGKTTKQTGQNLRQSVLNPQAEASPWYTEELAKQSNVQQFMNLSGNAKNQLAQMPNKMETLGNKIKSLLTGKKVDNNVLTSNVQKQLDDVAYLGDMNVFKDAVKTVDKRLVNVGNDATKLYQLKAELSGEMSPIFNKLSSGKDLLPKEAAKYAYWRGIKKALDSVSPEINKLNSIQQTAYVMSHGLKQNVGKGGLALPIVGKQFGNTSQSIKDLTGRGMIKTGTALDNVLGKGSQQLSVGPVSNIQPQALLENALFGRKGQPALSQPQQQNIQIPDQTMQQPTSPIDNTQQQTQPAETQQPNQITYEQLQQVMLSPNITSKTKNLVLQLYKLQPQANVSAIEKGKMQEAQAGLNLVDVIEDNFKSVQETGGAAKSGGLLNRALGKVSGEYAAMSQEGKSGTAAGRYKKTKEAFLSKLSRASGEKGVLTDKDLQRIAKALPDFSDSPEVAKAGLDDVRKIIGAALQRKQEEVANFNNQSVIENYDTGETTESY